ncbi:molybdopterin-containing oxidoreductase family protein [Arabiibacter massiliensis]|uniref:molybdopterin-containing oxidoreductase family protein n=1 Tax=Arabiibacter massiliensis TaxID=1870985 RepID=UPI00155A643A|nr:molybdopterin-dependent oxidoreductase [Arabiibacter massiliensis]
MAELTRRTFFKGAAALGAAAVLGGCANEGLKETEGTGAPSNEPAAEPVVEVKHAWCKMCGPARTHCSTLCTIKDGRWVNVEGNPEAGNNFGRGSRTLCAKGNAAMHTLYSPTRLLYPMKRTGEKGEGKFEKITWDEAMDTIAAKLKEQKEQYGPESYGVLSPQFYAVLGSLGRRFLNVHGSPNYLHSAICNSQRMFSRLVTIGGPAHAKATDTAPGQLNKTKLLVVWGYNSENSAVNQGNPCKRMDAKEAGMQIVDIRPMQEGLGSHADIWMPVRPGTDTALAMAFLNVIIGEDLYDHDFVENWTNGFDELAEHIKQYTPAWAAEITGLPEAQITEVARLMGTVKPMGINIGNGIGDQANDGHWTVACACIIEAITGNLGIAGGGGAGMVMPEPLIKTKGVDLLSDRLPASEEDEANGWMPGVAKLVAPETPRWFQTMMTQESGPTSAYNKGLQSILTEDPYPLRFVFGQSSNPMSATRQPKTIAEALKKLDYYVVMDTAWNSSCDYADIVLPACTQYEAADQFATKNSPAGTFIGINQVLAEPMGESRSDWEYYLDLAVRMGYGADFWDGDVDKMLSEQLDGSGITLEELREKGYIFKERTDDAKPTEPEYQTYEKMFSSLPGGKVQCVNDWIGDKPNATDTGTISRLPVYTGAPESIAGTPDIAAEYPLVISDVHAYRLCNHSYYHDVPYLRELQPEPWVKINPATAKKYGIEDGGWMNIESPHGSIKMVARYFEAIAPDVLMTKRGWWEPCEELGLPGYGTLDGGSEVNVLYDDTMTNYDGFTSAMAKQTLVKISKSEG